MKKYFFTLAILFCSNIFIGVSQSQIPGSWEKHIVCTKCTLESVARSSVPGKLDFFDSEHGMLVGDD